MEAPIVVGPDARLRGGHPALVGLLIRMLNGDRLAYGLVFSCAACVILLTFLLAYELWANSALSRVQVRVDLFT